MYRFAILALTLFALCGCKAPEESHSKVIIGAVLVDGLGGPPLSNSVVVIAGGQIRAAGRASTVPIPAESDKIDGSGRYLMPALVPVRPNIDGQDETALTKAREARKPAIGRANTLAEVVWLVDHGASGVVGMVRDTEKIDPDFIARLRDLRITFAPALASGGENLETAKHNTRRLFEGGVPLALAAGVDPQRELEQLVEAGVPPLDAIVAGTRNGAAALQDGQHGTVQVGKSANLLLLSANPGEDIRNLRKVALRMAGGMVP